MKYFLLIFSLGWLLAGNISCQEATPTGQKPDEQEVTSVEYDYLSHRITHEDIVEFPANQNIQIAPRAMEVYRNVPELIFKGYDGTAFLFAQMDASGNETDSLWTFNFCWDNRAPVPFSVNNIKFDLPDGDHLLMAYLIDDDGFALRTEGSFVGKMIRVKEGEIIKMDDSGILMYYNMPHGKYNRDEAIPLDFMILNEVPAAALSIEIKIDGQSFWAEASGRYDIHGLKPGKHMVELILYRSGDIYNVPLNPSRMTFEIE